MNKPWVIYTRLSLDPKADKVSPQEQEAHCRDLASREGVQIGQVFCDRDKSGSKLAVYREGWEQALEALASGQYGGMYYWKQDRLTRKWDDLPRLWLIGKQHSYVQFKSPVEGELDVHSNLGMIMGNLKVFAAAEYSKSISDNVKRARNAEALAGKPPKGGQGGRLFGYDKDMNVILSEAVLVQEMAQRVLAGQSLYSLKKDLDSRGAITSGGNLWSAQTLKDYLTNWHLTGHRAMHGEIVHRNAWEPILEESVVEALRSRLKPSDSNRKGWHGSHARKYLLTGGFTECGLCGSPLHALPNEGQRRYGCRGDKGGCGKLTMMADWIETYIAEALFHIWDSDEAKEKIFAANGNGHEAEHYREISTCERKLEELDEDRNSDRITREQHLRMSKDLRLRVDRARIALARSATKKAVTTLPSAGNALRREWEVQDLEWKRSVLALVLDRIIVNPASEGIKHTFETSIKRLDPRWRA